MRLSATTRLWLRRTFGLVLVSILVYQIKHHGELDIWWENLLKSWQDDQHKWWLITALLLMPVNLLLETSKWRLLLRHGWQASWTVISRAVLAGISVSLLTPNRIGEYGGRAILAPKQKAATIVMTTFIGNICQWLAFICCGWPSIIYLLGQRETWSTPFTIIIAITIPIVALSVVFLGPLMARAILRRQIGQQKKWIRWVRLKLWSLRKIRLFDLSAAFILALLRLFVYTFQYLLLLWFFDIPLSWWLGVSGIFSIYLIQAGIPLPPGLDVITRSELAIWMWGKQLANPIGILSATFSLYLINLIIPALLGSWLIVKKENSKP